VPYDPAEKVEDRVRRRGARCGNSIQLYIHMHEKCQLGRCAEELYIGVKLVNAYLQKLLVY